MSVKQTVKDMHASMKGKRGTVRKVEVEPTSGDAKYKTTTHFYHGDMGPGEPAGYIEPKETAHKNLKSVHGHLKTCYGDCEEKE